MVDLTYNRIVKNYINVYTRNRREQVRIMLGLSDYYFPIFEEIFDLYGVPYEIKYLSVIESALNPRAVSGQGCGRLAIHVQHREALRSDHQFPGG